VPERRSMSHWDYTLGGGCPDGRLIRESSTDCPSRQRS
jgi:hypothetical protein